MTLEKFDKAYLALIKNRRILDSSLNESASLIVKQCVTALSVNRASVWVFHDDESVMHCLSLYSIDTDTYESGAILDEEIFPRYFDALNNERVIDAVSASEDPRTSELTQSYLAPLNIHSLLDATLRHKDKIKGVLCLEMIGCQRDWTKDEKMFVASVADFVSQRIVVDDLERSESKYKSLYDYTSEGMAVFDGEMFSDVNPALCRLFRAKREELEGMSPLDLSPEIQSDGRRSIDVAGSYITDCLSGARQNFEWTHQRLDGSVFHCEITLNAIKYSGKETLFALFRDITDEKYAEEQARQASDELVFRAAHDSLTGLMNRDQLHKQISTLINNSGGESGSSEIVLLLMDLNRFKEVNDTLGHAAGDRVLIQLSDILNKQVSEIGGSLFRLGGDEFVAVFDNENTTEPFERIESMLHRCLKTSIILDDINIEMSASIGIAIYPENGSDSHELLRCADVAMYHAKNSNGLSSWYDVQNDMNSKRRLAMVVELGAAIEQDQLVLHFQPRIEIKTGEVTGCEALVRWQHPQHGMVPPNEFLPTAEMSDLIHPLTEWVLLNVAAQIKRMNQKGIDVPIAMNLSTKNLTDSRFVDKLQSVLSTENIDPRLLEIEITESALMDHPQTAIENLERLDELGVSIAIDDFGTGYSSLSYLKKLPIDTLKIDRSFVMEMLTDESDSVIVNSTIQLAHNFSLTVVAEGVEDQATLDELALKNCDQAQGFFIARPMPIDAFDAWLNDYCGRFGLREAS